MKPASIAMGTVFLGTVFVLLPAGAIQFNDGARMAALDLVVERVQA